MRNYQTPQNPITDDMVKMVRHLHTTLPSDGAGIYVKVYRFIAQHPETEVTNGKARSHKIQDASWLGIQLHARFFVGTWRVLLSYPHMLPALLGYLSPSSNPHGESLLLHAIDRCFSNNSPRWAIVFHLSLLGM